MRREFRNQLAALRRQMPSAVEGKSDNADSNLGLWLSCNRTGAAIRSIERFLALARSETEDTDTEANYGASHHDGGWGYVR